MGVVFHTHNSAIALKKVIIDDQWLCVCVCVYIYHRALVDARGKLCGVVLSHLSSPWVLGSCSGHRGLCGKCLLLLSIPPQSPYSSTRETLAYCLFAFCWPAFCLLRSKVPLRAVTGADPPPLLFLSLCFLNHPFNVYL